MRHRWLLMGVLALGACSEPERSSAPAAPPPLPAVEAPAAPPRDAWLAVLRADGLAVFDADDLAGAPRVTVPTEATEEILEATAEPRFLLRDDPSEAHRRIVLADAGGAKVLSTDGQGAFFLPDGRSVVQGRRSHFSCGGVSWDPFLELRDRGGERVREIPGSFLGYGPEGTTLVLVQPVAGPCRPMGGRGYAAPVYSRFDLATGATTGSAPDEPILVGLRSREGRVATMDLRGAYGLGSMCRLLVAGASYDLSGSSCEGSRPVVSPDGEWLAVSAMVQGGAFELQVIRSGDGIVVARHAGGTPSATIRTTDGGVRACFSPDGRRLVVARADGEIVLTPPEGGAATPLGLGDCVGFSPDGRYLLLHSTGERPSFRVVAVDEGSVRALPDALDARFLPAGARLEG